MSKGVKLFCWLLLFLNSAVFARTRDEVLIDAAGYSVLPWTPAERNILDSYNLFRDSYVPLASLKVSTDGIDDRFFKWNTQVTPPRWEYSESNWPFVVGSTVHGEAYAFSHWDTTGTFKTRLALEDKKWIAGRRGIGSPPYAEPLPAGYDGFSGLDCSGYLSELLGLSRHYSTGELKGLALKISTADVKAGDWLFRVPTPAHVVLAGDKLEGGTVGIYHAGSWRYQVSEFAMRTVSESAEYRIENDDLYLRYKSKSGDTWELERIEHEAYSAFPQFAWVRPSKDAPVLDPLNEIIELDVVSKSSVVPSSVMLVSDDHLPDATTVYAGAPGFSVTPSSESGHARVRYAVPPVYWLAPGEHAVTVYASNLLDLRDGSRLAFTVPDTNDTALLAWEDAGPLPFMTGGQRGSNTPATAHWLHTERVVFRSSASAAPLTDFVIYEDDTMATELYRRDFVPGTLSADISEALTGFADKTEYYALLRDELGRATSMYFHLDKAGPVIVTTVTARLNESHTGLLYGARGRAGHLL